MPDNTPDMMTGHASVTSSPVKQQQAAARDEDTVMAQSVAPRDSVPDITTVARSSPPPRTDDRRDSRSDNDQDDRDDDRPTIVTSDSVRDAAMAEQAATRSPVVVTADDAIDNRMNRDNEATHDDLVAAQEAVRDAAAANFATAAAGDGPVSDMVTANNQYRMAQAALDDLERPDVPVVAIYDATIGNFRLYESMRYGLDPQDGRYLGSQPGDLPAADQILTNLIFGRSQRPDPDLEGLTPDEVRDLEVGQQRYASIASNAIVFGLGDTIGHYAPGIWKVPAQVLVGRVVNPVAQEASDIYSDYQGDPNVIPGPGWVSTDNLGDVVPSAGSIVAGGAAQNVAKGALLASASLVGISIPEPITTLVGLGTAILVGSEVFVLIDNSIPQVLPSIDYTEPEVSMHEMLGITEAAYGERLLEFYQHDSDAQLLAALTEADGFDFGSDDAAMAVQVVQPGSGSELLAANGTSDATRVLSVAANESDSAFVSPTLGIPETFVFVAHNPDRESDQSGLIPLWWFDVAGLDVVATNQVNPDRQVLFDEMVPVDFLTDGQVNAAELRILDQRLEDKGYFGDFTENVYYTDTIA